MSNTLNTTLHQTLQCLDKAVVILAVTHSEAYEVPTLERGLGGAILDENVILGKEPYGKLGSCEASTHNLAEEVVGL